MKVLIQQQYIKHQETIHNIFWRGLQVFGKQGINFLIFILCARLLTPYDFGIYNYVFAVVLLLVMFGDFGVSTATAKYVAEYNITDQNRLRGVLFNAGVIIFVLTILITIVTLIFGKSYLNDKYIYITYLLPLLFLAPITSLYDGIYMGLKRFKQSAIISLTVGIISLFFIYFLIKSYGLIGALISQDIFYLILCLGLGIGYRNLNFKFNKDIIKGLGKYSLIIGLGSVGLILYSRIDILFLGHFNYIKEIAYYEIINKMLALILIPFSIIAQVIAPYITQKYANEDYKYVYKKYISLLFFSFCSSVIVVMILFFLKDIILNTFFKEYAVGMNHIFVLMLVVFFTQMLNGIAPLGFATATGHAKIGTYFLIIFGIIHVILNYLFLDMFGYIGIIYSIVITKSIADISYLIYYKYKLKCLIIK